MTSPSDISRAYPKMASYAGDLVQTANRLGIDPAWLANVINFESGGNPQARNRKSNATGLIQFIPSTARKLGTSVDALAKMSGKDQLAFVERYFAPWKGKMSSQADVYMVVFYPAAVGKGLWFVFPAAVQRANPGIRTAKDYFEKANARARLVVETGAEIGLASWFIGGAVALALIIWKRKRLTT